MYSIATDKDTLEVIALSGKTVSYGGFCRFGVQ